MRFIVFFICTGLFAAPILPTAFEARTNCFTIRAAGYSATIGTREALIQFPETTVRFRAVNAAATQLQPGPALPGHINYISRDSHASYALHRSVRWHNTYPGVDFVFRDNPDHFEYDVELAAHADLGRVALTFDNIDRLRIDDATGDLILTVRGREIREPKPVAYQEDGRARKKIDVGYAIDSAHNIRFRAAAYNTEFPLIIDPELIFENIIHTTAGASRATAIALDPQGNIYIAGHTLDPNFPHTGSSRFIGGLGQYDSFIAKWTPDGSQLIYATFLGGTLSEFTTGLAVDPSGIAYIAGNTTSQDFPVTANAVQRSLSGHQNAFFAKLSSDGSQILYATYLGGGSDGARRLAIDNAGGAVLVGATGGGFPVTPGAFQSAPVTGCTKNFSYINIPTSGTAFVTRFAPDGSLAFSTLLGGSCSNLAHDVTLDSAGNAWVAGETNSSDFPVTAGALQPQFGGGEADGFLASFDPTGRLTSSTYLGGKGWEVLNAIALDHSGNIYLTGEGGGFQQPASPGAFQSQPHYGCVFLGIGPPVFTPQGSAFVLKLDPTAASVQGLTYIGQPCGVDGNSIALDSSGAPWISSTIFSAGTASQPTASPLQQQIGIGLISKFSPDLTQLLFSTYFDQSDQLVLDNAGLAYVAGAVQPAVNTLPEQAFFAKLDGSVSAISLDSVVAAAPNVFGQNGSIGPGEVLRIAGKNMGPADLTPGNVANNAVATSAAGVRVTFDGIPAPLLSVSATEIQCVSPFALAGRKNTLVQVQYNGVLSNAVLVNVVPAALEVLGVFNDDFTPNSQTNPAAAGSNMMVYLSGAGNTVPPSPDGQVNTLPAAAPPSPVTLSFLENTYQVTFAGAAPGLVAGILQVNFIAGQTSASNVNLRIAGALTYFPMYVK